MDPFSGTDNTYQSCYPDGGDQPIDRILEALATPRRRYTCYHLQESDTADLDDLAQAVAAMEKGRSPDEIRSEVIDDVKADLYHHALPKLSALDVIEYDSRSKMVRYRHPPDHFEQFLDIARDHDPDR